MAVGTILPNFQPGFRLFDGTALNAMVAQLNALGVASNSAVNTAISTAGAGSLTAAALIGGVITRTGPSAVFTDTTATGAQLDTALGSATADDGTTQTAAMVSGGTSITVHVSAGGTTPSLTLPLGTDMDTALPDMRTGQSYLLQVRNTNSGQATVVTNTGWTTTGTLTLATNTTRDFVVTKTGTATYTLVAVGVGTA